MADGGRSKRVSPLRKEELGVKVRELELKLVIANEALRAKSAKCQQTERALEECQSKNQAMAADVKGSYEIIQRMKREFGQAVRMEEMGKIMVPALMHDLGNLIAAVRSHAQFCIENMPLTAPVEENLQVIYEGSQQADKLIRNFLDLFKVIKFDRLKYIPVDINETLARMWNTVKVSALTRQVSFSLELEENLPEVQGDVQRLDRVFLNLFLNAIQAVSEKGNVTIRTRFLPSEKMVEIHVIDDGPGIPKECRERIFEPFFTTKEKGTGLGLSICQLIVGQHNGSITLSDSYPRGTVFAVKLPAVDQFALAKKADELGI
jgi:signal transduction histidine kinase